MDATPNTAWLERFDRELADGKLAAAMITSMDGLELAPPFFKIMPRRLLVITHREGHEERGLQGRPGRHHDAQAGARPFTTKACSSPRWPAPSTRSGRSPPTS